MSGQKKRPFFGESYRLSKRDILGGMALPFGVIGVLLLLVVLAILFPERGMVKNALTSISLSEGTARYETMEREKLESLKAGNKEMLKQWRLAP
jgi:hypothetical protein